MTTKTEPSAMQALIEEIARLKQDAESKNITIGIWDGRSKRLHDQLMTLEQSITRLIFQRDQLLQQAAAKEAELKRLLETLEP